MSPNPPSISVVIVGAGLAGLMTAIGLRRAGHQVTVLEKAPELGQIGAGIQVPPNATRIFKAWGLLDALNEVAEVPESATLRSYRGEALSRISLLETMEPTYGTPYLSVHRVDLHHLLAQTAKEEGAQIRLGVDTQDIKTAGDRPVVQLADGEIIEADLILGADGERSTCRRILLNEPNMLRDSGEHVYRVTVPIPEIAAADEELQSLLSPPQINLWIGPGGNALTYRLKRDNLFNVVFMQEHGPESDVPLIPQRVGKEVVAQEFQNGWDPKFWRILDLTSVCTRWTLLESDIAARWSDETGRVALIGDAAHAMGPYAGQGAALAFEDAAVLSTLFQRMVSPAQIPDLLTIYETIRKPRVEEMKRQVRWIRQRHSMRDGPQQEERDRQLREQAPFAGTANFLADPVFQPWMFGYDALAEADKAWKTFSRGEFPGTRGTWREGVNGSS
ncbi:FAD/NAD(P)-binding domain-containing protein [Aspergillus heteromorphus CBS 117.55]|uniref:FAD/NAD(P)-binding domain-containing protein n=1 Tax=Aspergillus heteromorphus CBS 117.55 TaxID=1448321 RepID=A0A317WRM4_9EURO|nr:FAD/NAD(P)-binding domain-containing protein [Aspergillus heteromorphus CBS 117.55]PWY88381.1 FAD/NAD(P)-binding domain-containing protein [Aspergillus heteromorphus CBS 117.55]